MTELNAEDIIARLAHRLAQMEVDLAIARSQIPTVGPEPEIGTEIAGEGVKLLEVIDGEKEDE